MKELIHFALQKKRHRYLSQQGIAAVEFAMILIPLLIMTFAIVDFGRLIQARLVVTNLSREGGSLASRDIESAWGILDMLQHGASPLNIATNGKIYIWKIRAGKTIDSAGQFHPDPDPYIDLNVSACGGGLSVVSSVSGGQCGGNSNGTPNLGTPIYNHLVFDPDNQTADISEVTVVEVFYNYMPITPISKLPGVSGLLTDSAGGTIISSKAVF